MVPTSILHGTEHLPNSKDSRTSPETQGKSRWIAPGGTLGDLVAAADSRAISLRNEARELERAALSRPPAVSLSSALKRDTVALIAEIKRASPSRGAIRPDLDPAALARAYERGGAAAISVLTEPGRFGGSNADLMAANAAARLPLLRKDFHVADVQLFEARAIGASAALLIARALDPSQFARLVRLAARIGLEVVAEVRDEDELETALSAGCHIIGVNNRNLETLQIESRTAETLIPLIPENCVAIAESGYSDRSSIDAAGASGADAVLVGSFLSAATDPESAVRELTNVSRKKRDR
jgi:indole-3-glycerol phosphate synthase